MAKPAYKSNQGRGLAGYRDLPGQDLEGRLEIAALKHWKKSFERYLIASHLFKLHRHLKPVVMEDKSHFPGMPPELSFLRLERRGAHHCERMIQNSMTRYWKNIFFLFWFTSSSSLLRVQAFTSSSNSPSFPTLTRRKGHINICSSFPCFWKLLCH